MDDVALQSRSGVIWCDITEPLSIYRAAATADWLSSSPNSISEFITSHVNLCLLAHSASLQGARKANRTIFRIRLSMAQLLVLFWKIPCTVSWGNLKPAFIIIKSKKGSNYRSKQVLYSGPAVKLSVTDCRGLIFGPWNETKQKKKIHSSLYWWLCQQSVKVYMRTQQGGSVVTLWPQSWWINSRYLLAWLFS